MSLNIDDCKSYATEANLIAALARAGLDKARSVTVRNRAGRWTAIFPLGLNQNFGGNVTFAARHGFLTVN